MAATVECPDCHIPVTKHLNTKLIKLN